MDFPMQARCSFYITGEWMHDVDITKRRVFPNDCGDNPALMDTGFAPSVGGFVE